MEECRVTPGKIEFAYDYREGSGTPLLFLHGVTSNASTFDDVMDKVPTDRTIYNFDQRGHGRSGWSSEKAYGLGNYVDDVCRILEEVTGPALIVGWSMGGAVGVLAAGREPQLSRGVLMAESSPFVGETEESWSELSVAPVAFGLAEVVRALPDHDLEWAVEEFGGLDVGGVKVRDVMPPNVIRGFVVDAAPMDPDIIGVLFSSSLGFDVNSVLRAVVCPVRLVRGNPELGGAVPEQDARRLAANTDDFDERHDPEAGHGIHRRPFDEAFAQDIRQMVELVP